MKLGTGILAATLVLTGGQAMALTMKDRPEGTGRDLHLPDAAVAERLPDPHPRDLRLAGRVSQSHRLGAFPGLQAGHAAYGEAS